MEKHFETIIDNPLFFQWVFKPSDSLNAYWKNYMKEHPAEVDFIKETKENLKKLKHQNNILTSSEKDLLSYQILQKLEVEDRKHRRLNIFKSISKYAAVAILFSCLSGLLVYFQYNSSKTDFDKYSLLPVMVNEPTLILSENQKISLQKSESEIEYSKSGKIVLNKTDELKTRQQSTHEIKTNQIVIPFGNQSKVKLSDGTTVWLNAGSRLIYPSKFVDKTREVVLLGEAYFDVAHNKEKPFIVKTSSLDIRVLGTQFNVSAYPDDKYIQTVLKEGSVSIKENKGGFFKSEQLLKPNQLNRYNTESGESRLVNVNAVNYTVWIDGLLHFDDLELRNVIKKVERYYNIQVNSLQASTIDSKISGKLDLSQNIDEVMEYLSRVSKTKYEKINDRKFLLK